MPNRVTKLEIDSVDSCDRGAAGDKQGRGRALVMLRKRDGDPLVDDIVRRAAAAGVPLADVTKALKVLRATSKRDDSSERTKPMSLDFNDPGALVGAITKQLMESGMSLDGATTQILKAARAVPKVIHAKPASDDDGDEPDADDFEQQVKAHMAKTGCSRLEAINHIGSKMQRAEKIAKNQSW